MWRHKVTWPIHLYCSNHTRWKRFPKIISHFCTNCHFYLFLKQKHIWECYGGQRMRNLKRMLLCFKAVLFRSCFVSKLFCYKAVCFKAVVQRICGFFRNKVNREMQLSFCNQLLFLFYPSAAWYSSLKENYQNQIFWSHCCISSRHLGFCTDEKSQYLLSWIDSTLFKFRNIVSDIH